MVESITRRFGARAFVRAVFAFALVFAPARRAFAQHLPIVLEETEAEPGVVVYPARAQGTSRATIVLHGMCGEPERTCSYFSALVTEREHLICPRARRRCEGGAGSTWPERASRDIEAAVARARRALGDRCDEREGLTLIGYSLGAFRALALAEAGRGRYARVMLIGAKVYPHERLLREGGVTKLLLAAGDWDMMNAHMQQQTKRLERAGYPARFIALGRAGHSLTETFVAHLPAAFAWLRSDGVE